MIVRAAPDDRFTRRGPHLYRNERVTVSDAVLGTTLRVPTLGPPVRVRRKPGTQPGTVLRVAGKGLPASESTRRGDLYVQITIHIPQTLSREERDLYERLRTLPSPADCAAAPAGDDDP